VPEWGETAELKKEMKRINRKRGRGERRRDGEIDMN
jgi:hypothetical protein